MSLPTQKQGVAFARAKSSAEPNQHTPSTAWYVGVDFGRHDDMADAFAYLVHNYKPQKMTLWGWFKARVVGRMVRLIRKLALRGRK